MNVFLTSFHRRKVMMAEKTPSEQLTLWPPVLLCEAPKLSAICLRELPTLLHLSTSWLWLWLWLASSSRGGGDLSVFVAGFTSSSVLLVVVGGLLLLLQVSTGEAGLVLLLLLCSLSRVSTMSAALLMMIWCLWSRLLL